MPQDIQSIDDLNNASSVTIRLIPKRIALGDNLPFDIVPDPVHYYVAFYANETEIVAIHGLAFDRETGEDVAVGQTDDTLRSIIAVNGILLNAESGELFLSEMETMGDGRGIIVAEITDTEEFNRIYQRAFGAVDAINDMNLTYDRFSPLNSCDAQNSNTVAATILNVMGFDWPSEANYFAPGRERLLLPEDWEFGANDYAPFETGQDAMIGLDGISYEFFKSVTEDPIPDGRNYVYATEFPEIKRYGPPGKLGRRP